MAFFSVGEALDIIIMTGLIGWLFMGYIPLPREMQFWERLKWSSLFLAPAIILHELAHKFVAIGFGLDAVFHAFYANSTTLMLGIIAIIMKLTGLGFVFLVPGFVSISGNASPLVISLTAFAGPFIHLAFWLVCSYLLKKKADSLSDKKLLFVAINARINKWLFILNMLPIPGIDGYSVFSNLFQVIA